MNLRIVPRRSALGLPVGRFRLALLFAQGFLESLEGIEGHEYLRAPGPAHAGARCGSSFRIMHRSYGLLSVRSARVAWRIPADLCL